MNAIKVDEAHRIQLAVLAPGDLYEPVFVGPDEITLRRVIQAVGGNPAAAVVRVEQRAGYSVGVSDQPISPEALHQALSEFP